MKIGFSGLGRMGSSMVQRLINQGHEVIVLNRSQEPVHRAVAGDATPAKDPADLIKSLDPVIVWLMLPDSIVAQHLRLMLPVAPKGSIFIDGGNSDYRNTKLLAEQVGRAGSYLVDVGTSGGILGLKSGYCLMIGGDGQAVKQLEPIFNALAQPGGWKYFGSSGSGHFVKMVHNAIEYGIMESYAEGYRLLGEGPYSGIDLAAAGKLWQHGSIIASLLNELAAEALAENPKLQGINGAVAESGEAKWAIETAKQLHISMPAIEAAFDIRLRSQRGEISYATKLLAAMRHKFGGHNINPQRQRLGARREN